MRQHDQKRKAVEAFQGLGFRVLAAGDSYNDLTMLQVADAGFWFCAPQEIALQHPQLATTNDYQALTTAFLSARDC